LLTITVTGRLPVSGVCALSVAVTVKANEPTLVGVPESDPSLPSIRPGGRAPAVTVHVNGGEPPLATLKEKPG
jgi:hypothetical protein